MEGAILTYLRILNVVAPNKNFNITKDAKYSGAFVMDPKPGRYDWIYDLDLTSMYPSIIMSLNISPEMKVGKVNGWKVEDYVKKTQKQHLFI